ncbi:hypothetical protein [Mycobacterium asiaticum]|nr:hypothetical protein [Mycobacterium asiaticum]
MDWETSEWGAAVHDMSEFERAPYDDAETYADLMSADGVRL